MAKSSITERERRPTRSVRSIVRYFIHLGDTESTIKNGRSSMQHYTTDAIHS